MSDWIAQAVAPLVKASWVGRATVTRPDGVPTFDGGTGTYSDTATTVATGMRCALMASNQSTDTASAGDPQTRTRLRLEHDPTVELKVDDRVTFTTHPDLSVNGTTFYVVSVQAVDRGTFGLAYVQRTEPDSGS